MELKHVSLIPRTLEAVQYTAENAEEVRLWIQGNSPFREIVRDPKSGRLYLPLGRDGIVDIVEYGEWILRDPESGEFTSALDSAIQTHYDIEEAPVS